MAARSNVVTLHWLAYRGPYTDVIAFDGKHWRNPARAQRVIDFVHYLIVTEGEGEGGRFKLRDWQQKFIRDVYEPCDETGRRTVRWAVLSMGRKNGKTALIAALALAHMIGPERIRGGEIYSAANDKDQAGIIYKHVSAFIQRGLINANGDTRSLDAADGGPLTCVPSTKRIVNHGEGTFYRALSRDMRTKHGLSPTVVIYDELSQALDRDLYDVLDSGFGARKEPLMLVISTQSRDPGHIMSELIDNGLDPERRDAVCHLWAVPDDVDPFDESLWHLANPALGDFLSLHEVRNQAAKAKTMPSALPSFLNLTLNQRIDMTPGLLERGEWEACHDPNATLVPGEEIYLGLDLSATTDLCALAAVSAHNGERLDAWFWKPRELIKIHETRDRAQYERWMTEGHLIAAPGRDVDYDLVAAKIGELSVDYKIIGVAFDRWRINVLMKCFERMGIPVYYGDDENDGIRFVEWGQGFKDMGPAVGALEKSVAARTLAHRGHPVLTWCFSNAVATQDPAGNRKLDKSKARFRIDGAVAATMAIGLKARDMIDDGMDIDGWLADVVSVSA